MGDDFHFAQREDLSNPERRGPEIELRSPTGKWTGTLPYLSRMGRVGKVACIARAPGKLLIGSNRGHVECVNIATGESLWLYVFPTIRQTMSFSSHGMPPMMSQAAAIFRKENESLPTSGLKLADQPAKPPRIIPDPEPMNPFEKLPFLLGLMWGSAILPVIAVAIVRLNPRTRKWNLELASALTVALLFGCFILYGRVSPGSSIALRIAMLVFLVVGTLDVVKHMQRGKWLFGAMIICVFVVVALLLFPFMFRI